LLRIYLDVVLQVCSLSPSRRVSFLRSASLGQCTVFDRRVITFVECFILYLPLKTFIKLSEYFICLILVCDVLCVITSVMAPRNDSDLD
jgi:hypothetical protein